jgi:hypothetical protein
MHRVLPAGVAQLAEQPSCKRQVSGSIPLTGSGSQRDYVSGRHFGSARLSVLPVLAILRQVHGGPHEGCLMGEKSDKY